MNSYSISQIMETLTVFGFFTAIFLSFYFYLRFRNKERMALIEKGVDVSEIFRKREISFKFPWFRLGMLILGIGLGVFVAYLLIVLVTPPPNRSPYYFDGVIITFSLLIFGGIGIIFGHILERSGKKKNG